MLSVFCYHKTFQQFNICKLNYYFSTSIIILSFIVVVNDINIFPSINEEDIYSFI